MPEHRPSEQSPVEQSPSRQRPSEPGTERPDLAEMLVRLARALAAVERPVLEAHGVSMWAYAALLGLGDRPLRTQVALAEAIGADKSRLIGVLDDLQRRELIERSPDPSDRRARLLSLTDHGRRLRDSCRAAIREQEELVLAHLPDDDRRGFLNALRLLSPLTADELTAAGGGDQDARPNPTAKARLR